MRIQTTIGEMDERELDRTVIYEDNPEDFIVRTEWRHHGELVRRDALRICDHEGRTQRTPAHGPIMTTQGVMDAATLRRYVVFEDRPDEYTINVYYLSGDEVVRKDAHVIKKEASEAMTAVAATM